MATTSSPAAASSSIDERPAVSAAARAVAPDVPPPMTATSVSTRQTGTSRSTGGAVRSGPATTGSGGFEPAGCRTTAIPGRAAVWQVRT